MKTDLLDFAYKNILKPVMFSFDADSVHDRMTDVGEFLGEGELLRKATGLAFKYEDEFLEQKLMGIDFSNPVGLSAGFDYEGRLTQIMPEVGFGFETVGTVTFASYEGNPKPQLGRLPKSRSLLVNKGFRSAGAKAVADRLEKLRFEMPVGISIGRTNTKELDTLKKSIDDILEAFRVFDRAAQRGRAGGQERLGHSYYEMNISCPNLINTASEEINFYPAKNLDKLLTALDKLKLKKPLFLKMPITESDKDVLSMLAAASKHNVAGVIFGNLEKNRKNPVFNKTEIKNAGVGNFSGRPTFKRSNELISLTRKKYKDRFVIVGTGGVFNEYDAYEKIKRGASLVQMITGMIYEGPQVVGKINRGLVRLAKEDGFTHISEAVGISV